MASARSVLRLVHGWLNHGEAGDSPGAGLRRLLAFPIAVTALIVTGGSATAQPGGGGNPIPPVAKRPNFVVIVLDDLGTDKLGFYGQAVAWGEGHAVTPNLDAIAASGALFWNAYASPLCSPSRAMLLTGRHAFRTGMFNLSDLPNHKYDLPDTEVTLPKMLEHIDDRYTAGAFGKWHLTGGNNPDLECQHPISSGFDVFLGHLYNHGDHFAWNRIESRADVAGCAQQAITTWSGTQVRIDAWNWIQEQDEPFFAYVAFYPPHAPVQVPPLEHVTPGLVPPEYPVKEKITSACPGPCVNPPCLETQLALLRAVHRANIEALDHEIGQLLYQLPANTYVFVIGDNGTEARAVQTADTGYSVAGAPYPPNHSKRTIAQLSTRIPLLVKGPGVVPGIRRAPVSAVDIWRTMAHLAGGGAPAGGDDSISFRPLLMAAESCTPPAGSICPPSAGSRQHAYFELAWSNGSKWNGSQWSPSPPLSPMRALVSYDGLKYTRYGSGTSPPSCILLQDCNLTVPLFPGEVIEEVHQIYTVGCTNGQVNFVACDENEIGTSPSPCPLPDCQSPTVATLRSIMMCMTGP